MREVRHPLVELTLARVKEFGRDPGAIFWTFGFPVVLAVALGLAFRSSPTPELQVTLACGFDCRVLPADLERSSELTVTRSSRESGLSALRRGKVDLMIEASDALTLSYRFDPTRPEGKSARMAAELAVDPNPSPRHYTRNIEDVQPGARYIDFLL